jgi:hypothetical protein
MKLLNNLLTTWILAVVFLSLQGCETYSQPTYPTLSGNYVIHKVQVVKLEGDIVSFDDVGDYVKIENTTSLCGNSNRQYALDSFAVGSKLEFDYSQVYQFYDGTLFPSPWDYKTSYYISNEQWTQFGRLNIVYRECNGTQRLRSFQIVEDDLEGLVLKLDTDNGDVILKMYRL